MKKIRVFVTPSFRLQLYFIRGVLVASPVWLLVYKLPVFDDCPLWVLIGLPLGTCALGLIWFRQCISSDGTAFKPKWW